MQKEVHLVTLIIFALNNIAPEDFRFPQVLYVYYIHPLRCKYQVKASVKASAPKSTTRIVHNFEE